MRAADAVVEILKREGVTTLFCFPTTSLIETAVAGGLRPVICRQERVGVDMADGYARVTNGRPLAWRKVLALFAFCEFFASHSVRAMRTYLCEGDQPQGDSGVFSKAYRFR